MRWRSDDGLEKDVEEKVRKIDSEANEIDVLQDEFDPVAGRREVKLVDLPYMTATPQQRRERIAAEREVLRSEEKDKRHRTVKWWVLYVLTVAAVSVPVVGLVAEFYLAQASGSDPAFILRRPSVSPEIVTTKTGRPIVGYVLSTGDKWFNVLTERTGLSATSLPTTSSVVRYALSTVEEARVLARWSDCAALPVPPADLVPTAPDADKRLPSPAIAS